MGLFGGGNSKRTTVNEDNRIINDLSNSTFDYSVDNSTHDSSYNDNSVDNTDNSYHDNSQSYEDNSYSDSSQSYEDNSYLDSSVSIDGEYAGNSGTIMITDGGAFATVDNAVSQFTAMGNSALQNMSSVSSMSLATMGKVSNDAITQASINNQIMKDLAANALQNMSDQATNTVSASVNANREALATTSKLMTSISTQGNDLLVDGVVNVVKYLAVGVGGVAVVFGVVSMARGKK